MPKLLSQFKHEELELNSSLQIRSQKEIRAKSEKNGTLQEFCMVPRISQPTEFHRLQNFVTCETEKPLATIHPPGHCSSFQHCSYCPFDFFTFCSLFGFLPTFSL